MRRILIIADRLMGGADLRERLALKKSTDPEVDIFVLVPQRDASALTDEATSKSAERILELAPLSLGLDLLHLSVEAILGVRRHGWQKRNGQSQGENESHRVNPSG